MKCEMCGCKTKNVVEIKNRINGNELSICRMMGYAEIMNIRI